MTQNMSADLERDEGCGTEWSGRARLLPSRNDGE